ncbi:MAG TPA: hypothetical protein DCP92_10630 [Nitrospiraceae bacterium]|nr:hypothetical protein [Nitrospiraceae bacterium]
MIEEGIIVPCSVDNTTCSGPAAVAPDDGSATDACGTTKAVSIPGKTLLNSHPTLSLATSPTGVAGQCNASVFAPNGFTPSTVELEGRIYYAQVNQTTGDVQRLATLNAEVLNDNLSETITTLNYTTTNVAHGPILHYESYPLELASQECLPAGVAGFPCYAYVAASTKAPANGDQVLNWCTYTDTTGSPATGVFNKFGAAATFGPTLVDLNVVRDTTLATTAGALNQLVRNFSLGYSAFTGFDFDVVTKTFADTHYFATPAPEIYDMNTGFSFSFPLQHFIGEADVISVNAIYDTLENTTVVPLGKFISPGLPTVESPSNEVTLQFISNPPFSEGWIRFQPLAVNATGSCTTQGGTGAIAGDPCGVIGFLPNGLNTVAANPSTPYVPGYSAAVFVTGANELSASLFQFSAELLAE